MLPWPRQESSGYDGHFILSAAISIPLLNRESRGIFGQDKPKSQKLGRSSLRQFAVLWVCPVRKFAPFVSQRSAREYWSLPPTLTFKIDNR
jgi:hypothetical protein